MTTISVKRPVALARRLETTAAHRRVKKSRIVRDALNAALDGTRGPRARSFSAVAGDLIGCISGPGDLSYHPRHMRGFGR